MKIKQVWDGLFAGKLKNSYNPKNKEITWADIKDVYGEQISLIRVQEINNKTKDILDYRGFKKDGKHVIAIGGNRLSRGLTLEGLNVSYYLRSARTSAVATATHRWEDGLVIGIPMMMYVKYICLRVRFIYFKNYMKQRDISEQK